MIAIYNTLSGGKEIVRLGDEVKFYLCGPTVYSYIHLGNARPLVFFDSVVRYLSIDHKVIFIQNFTDIDDKIIKKAEKEGISIKEVAEKYIKEYYKDVEELNIRKPDIAPKATEYIEDMIKYIEQLIKEGFAYTTSSGVYFDTSKFDDYGKLSKRFLPKSREDDFALWKYSGEIGWEASFGRGRPGWHIECSTMIGSTVGNVDIHAGGQDLIFPHHENEIAQHESINCTPLAKYWMHNSFIKINNKKMSKSDGNIIRVRDILAKYSGNVLRFFILSTHYRKPISFNEDSLDVAEKGFKKLVNFLSNHFILDGRNDFSECVKEFVLNFHSSMQDDFNTQGAISSVFKIINKFNSTDDISQDSYEFMRKEIIKSLRILGFNIEEDNDKAVTELAKNRLEMKLKKNYNEADLIRKRLLEMGVEVKDGQKPSWKRK